MAKQFTVEEVIKDLNSILPSDRVVSERSIKEVTENLFANLDDGIEQSNFTTIAKNAIMTLNGNTRAIKSEYEKKLALPTNPVEIQPKPQEQPREQPKGLTVEEVQKMLDERDRKRAEDAAKMEAERIQKAAFDAKRKTLRENGLKGVPKDLQNFVAEPSADLSDEDVIKFYTSYRQGLINQGIAVESSEGAEGVSGTFFENRAKALSSQDKKD